MTQPIESIIEVLDLPEMQLISSEFAETEEFEKTNAAFVDLDESAEITPIRDTSSEPIEEEAQEQTRALIPTPEATPAATSERAATSKENPAFISVTKTLNSIRRTRRLAPEVPSNDSDDTRSRRQAYATAIATSSDLTPYYSAFSEGLIRPEIDSKVRLHKNSLSPKPRYWAQVLNHRFSKEFQLTASKEVGELGQQKTYQLIEKKNQDQVRLPLTWVFKYKFDTNGYLTKFKARLCVRGDLQTTYEETYAATLAARTFRAVIAIAAAFDMEIRQYDAVNAFINSPLDEEIFCEYPKGFCQQGKCWKLLRALYDLKQAPML